MWILFAPKYEELTNNKSTSFCLEGEIFLRYEVMNRRWKYYSWFSCFSWFSCWNHHGLWHQNEELLRRSEVRKNIWFFLFPTTLRRKEEYVNFICSEIWGKHEQQEYVVLFRRRDLFEIWSNESKMIILFLFFSFFLLFLVIPPPFMAPTGRVIRMLQSMKIRKFILFPTTFRRKEEYVNFICSEIWGTPEQQEYAVLFRRRDFFERMSNESKVEILFLVFLVFLLFLLKPPQYMEAKRRVITTLRSKKNYVNFIISNDAPKEGRYERMNRRWSVSCFSCLSCFSCFSWFSWFSWLSCADHHEPKSYFDRIYKFYLFKNIRDPGSTRLRPSVSKGRIFGVLK